MVTGKLDVREAAASLPDEVDEQEPFEEADTDDAAADELEVATDEVEA